MSMGSDNTWVGKKPLRRIGGMSDALSIASDLGYSVAPAPPPPTPPVKTQTFTFYHLQFHFFANVMWMIGGWEIHLGLVGFCFDAGRASELVW